MSSPQTPNPRPAVERSQTVLGGQVPSRRGRYTTRACTECRRRKVKCTGDAPCRTCIATKSSCSLPTEKSKRGRRRIYGPVSYSTSSETASLQENNATQGEDRSLKLRVRRLEDQMRQLQQPAQPNTFKGTEEACNRSPDVTNEIQGSMTIASSSKDTVYSAQNNLESEIDDYMSFSRQIETLKRGNTNVESQESTQALSIPTVATPSSRPKYIHCRIHQSERLDRLLQLFMEEGDFYYPVIFGCNFKNRLDTLLREHRNKNGDGLSLPVDRVDLVSLAALACMVIACAETIDINTLELPKVQRRDGTSVTDQDTWRLEGRHLLESSNWQRSVNLDMVRFHLVEALFLLMCERLRESYHAMVTTASLALVTNLNNQDNWFANSEDERISKRVLWWTIYLMDRQVGHKCGKPYLIRDAEFVVDDFEDLLADSASKPTVDPSLLNEHLQFNCTYNTEWYRYLQFLAQWSQNFTKVWDALFSIRAARVTNEDQLELIDALILKLNRNLGPGLDWKPNMLPDLTAAPIQDLEHEQNLRLRLIIFTRFNLLRLLLHHKRFLLCLENQASVSHKREDCAFSFTVCQSLSIDTIDALAAVTVGRRIINPLGTFITMAIIECIYHLRILEQKSFQDHNSSIQYDPTIRKGIDCLRAMSASGVNMARNAIRELEGGQSKHAAAAGQAFERASPLENFGAMENDHDIQRWDGLDLNFPLLYPDWDFIN